MDTRALTLVGFATAAAVALGCNRSGSPAQPPAATAAAVEAGSTGTRAATDVTGVPLPPGATLVSTSAVDDVRVFPERGQVGGARLVAGAVGARGLEHVYQTPLSYRDAVAFYDGAISSGSIYHRDGGAPSRTSEDALTAWTFDGADGTPERVVVRDGAPTTIEVAAVTGESEAVEAEPIGRTNRQPSDDATQNSDGGATRGRRERSDVSSAGAARGDGGAVTR